MFLNQKKYQRRKVISVNFLLVFSLLTLIFLCSSAVSAEPTKKETYKYIKDKLLVCNDSPVIRYFLSDPKDIESIDVNLIDKNFCELEFVKSTLNIETSKIQEVLKYSVPLKDINPKEIFHADLNRVLRERGGGVANLITYTDDSRIFVMNTTGYKKTIYSKNFVAKNNIEEEEYVSRLNFSIVNSCDAERILKALIHLVEKCGGKDDGKEELF